MLHISMLSNIFAIFVAKKMAYLFNLFSEFIRLIDVLSVMHELAVYSVLELELKLCPV